MSDSLTQKGASLYLFEKLFSDYPALLSCKDSIKEAFFTLVTSFSNNRKLLVCGNGGSSADADHIVGELMKDFKLKRKAEKSLIDKLGSLYGKEGEIIGKDLQQGLPAISLSAHQSLFTAFLNDVGADNVFAQQVYGYGEAGDTLLAISTSGNSRNVCNAIKVAKAIGIKTIALTGSTGGKLSELCDISIVASESATDKIQEYHLPIYHALCAMLEEHFFSVETKKWK